jgi:hypothetical protein
MELQLILIPSTHKSLKRVKIAKNISIARQTSLSKKTKLWMEIGIHYYKSLERTEKIKQETMVSNNSPPSKRHSQPKTPRLGIGRLIPNL